MFRIESKSQPFAIKKCDLGFYILHPRNSSTKLNVKVEAGKKSNEGTVKIKKSLVVSCGINGTEVTMIWVLGVNMRETGTKRKVILLSKK